MYKAHTVVVAKDGEEGGVGQASSKEVGNDSRHIHIVLLGLIPHIVRWIIAYHHIRVSHKRCYNHAHTNGYGWMSEYKQWGPVRKPKSGGG